MSEEARSYQCHDCRAKSPVVETEYTLISSRFGWRLTRRTSREGSLVLEWRCPTCWQRFKVDRQMSMTPVDGVPTFQYEPPNSSRRGNHK